MTPFIGSDTLSFYRAILPLFSLLLFLTTVSRCPAQRGPGKVEIGGSALQAQMQALLDALDAKEKAHAPTRELGYRWSRLGADYAQAGEFSSAENALNRALGLLSKDPGSMDLYAEALDELGALYRVYNRVDEAMNCQRKALKLRQQIGDPIQIARSQSHLAELALLSHKYKEALREADRAYQALQPKAGLGAVDKRDLLSVLVARVYAQCGLQRHAECLDDAQQALAMSRGAYPGDSLEAGSALVALSWAQLESGAAEEAENSIRQALGILKTELSPGDPRVLYAMTRDRDCLLALDRKEDALKIDAELSAVDRRTAQSCTSCTVGVNGLRASNR